MSNSTLRIFYILGFISIIGLFSVQIYWFKKAFDKTEFEFERSLTIALNETVKDLLKYNNTNTIPNDPVIQLDNNYYAIMVNDQIHADVLELYLKTEFDKFNIHQGYEYRIYDCQNKEMKFGGYVDGKAYTNDVIKNRKLPLLKEDNYYFTVYFPHKSMDIIKSMELWIFSSIILFIVYLQSVCDF
jgi:two-component system phosphate regulon sensor histidine kinase PhoR